MVVGTDLYGKVDSCENIFIATKFYMIARIPLIPLQSFYIHKNERGVNRPGILDRQEIIQFNARKLNNLNWKSVFVAYLRGLSLHGTFICAVFGLFAGKFFPNGIYWAIGLLIVAIISHFSFKKPNQANASLRSFVYQCTGQAIDPLLFNHPQCKQVIEKVLSNLEREREAGNLSKYRLGLNALIKRIKTCSDPEHFDSNIFIDKLAVYLRK